jgi:hypothetical protein
MIEDKQFYENTIEKIQEFLDTRYEDGIYSDPLDELLGVAKTALSRDDEEELFEVSLELIDILSMIEEEVS